MIRPAQLTALALAAAGAAPAGAEARVADRFQIGAEAGFGTILSATQHIDLDYSVAVQASVRPGFTIREPLVAQAVLGSWWFPSDIGYGRATLLGAGFRWQPSLGTVGRIYVDGHAGWGETGGAGRLMFDLGAGFDFRVMRALALGPAVRYGQVHTAGGDSGDDAKFWSVGLGLTVTFPPFLPKAPPPPHPAPPPPPPKKPRDSDGDGVPDTLDVCAEPAGEHPDPDPSRRGCPVKDRDGDGVPDASDRCAGEAAGPAADPDRPGCPDGDDDGDGVRNHADGCPARIPGLFQDPRRPGCPAPDRDGDAIPDDRDACQYEAGAPSNDVKKNGCPGLVRVANGRIVTGKPVIFVGQKDVVSPASVPVLQAVAEALKALPEVKKISIEAHADNKGDPGKSLDLTGRRAAAILDWLVRLGGVDGARLGARGLGDREPLESNDSAAGRAANRRVEFVIVDPAPAPAQTPAAEKP